jgi:hypothetical protein
VVEAVAVFFVDERSCFSDQLERRGGNFGNRDNDVGFGLVFVQQS